MVGRPDWKTSLVSPWNTRRQVRNCSFWACHDKKEQNKIISCLLTIMSKQSCPTNFQRHTITLLREIIYASTVLYLLLEILLPTTTVILLLTHTHSFHTDKTLTVQAMFEHTDNTIREWMPSSVQSTLSQPNCAKCLLNLHVWKLCVTCQCVYDCHSDLYITDCLYTKCAM